MNRLIVEDQESVKAFASVATVLLRQLREQQAAMKADIGELHKANVALRETIASMRAEIRIHGLIGGAAATGLITLVIRLFTAPA